MSGKASLPLPPEVPSPSLLKPAFIALFVQLQILLFASLCSSRDIQFIPKIKVQLDFADFYTATSDWLHHINPYLRDRFVTPPPSLLAALPFQPLGFSAARYVFFATNLVVLGCCCVWLAQHFKLTGNDRLLLFGVAAMFYPVMFAVERGNLDVLMLGLILIAIFSRNSLARAIALALSVSFKVYSILLFAPLVLRRHWKTVCMALACLAILLIGFHGLTGSFLHTEASRAVDDAFLENISPAAFLSYVAHYKVVRLSYALLWMASFLLMLFRMRHAEESAAKIACLPWMMALPLHVYPYTGVLLLPVLAQRNKEAGRRGSISRSDYLFLCGFLLVGTQQRAATEYFLWLTHSHQLFGTWSALGTLFVMSSILCSPGPDASAAQSV